MGFISSVSAAFNNLFSKKPTLPGQLEIVEEATKWIGIDENGPGVNTFRKAVNNSADGEPWCAGFVMYCARAVALRHNREPSVYPSELCGEIWFKSPHACRIQLPEPGCLVIWSYPGSIRGHVGIVEKAVLTKGLLYTIEGNTSGGKGSVHGVHRKERTITGNPGMYILGFLKPFV